MYVQRAADNADYERRSEKPDGISEMENQKTPIGFQTRLQSKSESTRMPAHAHWMLSI